jgi:hypothetical protein
VYEALVVVPTRLPPRYAPYDVTPTLSVEAGQERDNCDGVAFATPRLVGAIGAWVSLDGALAAAAAGELPDDPDESPEGVVVVVGGVRDGALSVGGVTDGVEGHTVVLETTAAKPELFPAESKAPTAIVYAVPQESLSTVS